MSAGPQTSSALVDRIHSAWFLGVQCLQSYGVAFLVTALVGYTGAGKSSVAKLLARRSEFQFQA